mgnify:CR=1 FL=1
MSHNHDVQRFESAEQSRAGLRIANQPAPDLLVTIIRYDANGIEVARERIAPPAPRMPGEDTD